jgi:hypothetical protein
LALVVSWVEPTNPDLWGALRSGFDKTWAQLKDIQQSLGRIESSKRAYLYASVDRVIAGDVSAFKEPLKDEPLVGERCCTLFLQYEILLTNRGQVPATQPRLMLKARGRSSIFPTDGNYHGGSSTLGIFDVPTIGAGDHGSIIVQQFFTIGGLRTLEDMIARVDTIELMSLDQNVMLQYGDSLDAKREEDSVLKIPMRAMSPYMRSELFERAKKIK